MASEKHVLISLLDHKRVLNLPNEHVSSAEVKLRVSTLFEDMLSEHHGEYFLQLRR